MNTVIPEGGFLVCRDRRHGVVVDTVVLHATVSKAAPGTIRHLRNVGLSYHYIIEKDGTVYKCAPASKEAYHAGVSKGPQGKHVNHYSIGISFVNMNDGKDPYTLAQTESLKDLISELQKQFPTLKYITTHYWVTQLPNGRSRKTDPRGYEVEGIAKQFGLEVWNEGRPVLR